MGILNPVMDRLVLPASRRLYTPRPKRIGAQYPFGMPFGLGGGARDDVFMVRHDAWPAVGESVAERAILNRLGSLVVTDFLDQLVLGGWAYHMQIGTETAPVNSTAAIDDALVWMLVDGSTGYSMIPLLAELNPEFADTSVTGETMLEVDKAKKRYSSGGTAFTPENLSGGDERSHNGAAYVGTDITAAAKSAVPDSIELARKVINEDVITDPTNGKMAWNPCLYSAKMRPLIKTHGPASILFHFGAGTADLNGFGVLQWAQIDTAMVS